ncbi:hypothetical protein ABZX92_12595 [Lentzea sp. NPDC006480]|uniref:hypothetical protein n=1 Tax=Lentzea sp. NPDC006480 TaxID=3157176 RepID=UPI0033ACCE92
MLTRRAVLAVSCLVLVHGAPASADPGWGTIDCSPQPHAGCELAAGITASTQTPGIAPTPDTAAGEFECRYVPVDNVDPGTPHPEGPGGWFRLLCSAEGKDTASRPPVWLPAGQQAPPAFTPEQVAQIARNRLRLPDPGIALSPPGEQLVNLPTWLWLRNGWRSIRATASVPGIAVTAVAEPVAVVWSTGDGATITCSGPGTPFAAGRDPKSASPDCGHVYRGPSSSQPGGVYRFSTTVRWNIRWSGAGQSGVFPDLTTTSSTALRVIESQALNSR